MTATIESPPPVKSATSSRVSQRPKAPNVPALSRYSSFQSIGRSAMAGT